MSVHPLVNQLRFTRSEFLRVLDGLSEEDARQRLLPVNSISWMVGHMANQEATYWLYIPTGEAHYRYLNDLVGYGKPASTPSLAEMLAAWHEITARTEPFLDSITPEKTLEFFQRNGRPVDENIGTLLLRVTHHYWFHTGEAYAVREMLGHPNLPEYVGDFGAYEWQG